MIIKLIDLFVVFFKIGLVSFGGGYTFVPLIEHQAVENYQWITHDEFMKIIGVTEAVPGAISIKFATYIGYKKAGIPGVIATVAGSSIVPVLAIILLFNLLKSIEKLSFSESVIKGIKSASWGLIIGLGVKSLIKSNMDTGNIIIGFGASIAIIMFNVSPALIIIMAGILGLLFY